jgi:hypothetical protein
LLVNLVAVVVLVVAFVVRVVGADFGGLSTTRTMTTTRRG